MADLTPVSGWDNVYEIATTDIVQGGSGGIANDPHQNLVNREEYLYDAITGGLGTPIDIKFKSSVDANAFFMDESAGKTAFGASSFPSGAGKIHIVDNDIPISLKESDQSGSGALWRLALNDKILRWHSSDNGTDFTAVTAGLHLHSDAHVEINRNNETTGDFNVKGETDDYLLYTDAGLDNVGIGMVATSTVKFEVDGSTFTDGVKISGATNALVTDGNVIFNNAGAAAADFTVKGDTDATLFVADAGLDVLSSGASPVSTRKLYIVSTGFSHGIYVHTTDGDNAGYFINQKVGGTAVTGNAGNSSGVNFGGDFVCASTSGTAVRGVSSANSGTTYAGYFDNDASPTGYGVYAINQATTGNAIGGYFQSDSVSGRAVRGYASSSAANIAIGGSFESEAEGGYGLEGKADNASGTNYGVRGTAANAASFAGWFKNTNASGYAVWGDTGQNGGQLDWVATSSRFKKTGLRDPSVLVNLRESQLKAYRWIYNDLNTNTFEEHIGTMLEDVNDAFNLSFDRGFPSSLQGGIALGGVIELIKEIDALKERIKILESK
jgi:hypothetical protein